MAFACASIALIVALRLTTVADVLIIMSTAPMFAAALAWLFLGERVSHLTLATIAATVIGIAMIVWNGLAAWSPASLLGDAAALAIAIGYAVAIVITRHNSHVAMTPAVLAGVCIAALVALPLAAPWPLAGRDAILIFIFGALQLGLGLAVFAAGARLVPAAQTALLGTIEPILGPLWVWLFVGEAPSTAALAGGTVVLASVTLHTLAESRNSAAETRPAT
jgi:drug/metabolite transporter (DMT)-like permease